MFHERIEYPTLSLEQLKGQFITSRVLLPPEESPVEAMELVRVSEVDPQEAEIAANEALTSAASAPAIIQNRSAILEETRLCARRNIRGVNKAK